MKLNNIIILSLICHFQFTIMIQKKNVKHKQIESEKKDI